MAALMAFALPGLGGEPAEQEDIYYRSQADADAALVQFDRDNPSCQLWTNWQKVCTRDNDSGTTNCTLDTARAVVPSTPYCVVQQQTLAQPAEGDIGFESLMRFCAETRLLTRTDATTSRTLSTCRRFIAERPFVGPQTIGPHASWCRSWRQRNGRQHCMRWAVPDWCSRAAVSGTGQLSREWEIDPDSIDVLILRPRESVAVNVIYCIEGR